MKSANKKRVLVVDNDEQVLAALRSSFEDGGLDAQTTWSGRDALLALESGRFDLLLTGDYLPDLHVTEFLSRVGRLPDQPVVVLMHSAVPKPSVARRYEALGAYAVVDKHDQAAVCRTVAACCSGGNLERATKSNWPTPAGGPRSNEHEPPYQEDTT
jgi:CheY-like chemotaxis protein